MTTPRLRRPLAALTVAITLMLVGAHDAAAVSSATASPSPSASAPPSPSPILAPAATTPTAGALASSSPASSPTGSAGSAPGKVGAGPLPGLMALATRTSNSGAYGAPLVPGCQWATWVPRCQNLTVYGNGGSFADSACGAPNGCTFGPEFQCTELAQRYAYYAWGEPAVWDGYGGANGAAYQMWNSAPDLPVPLEQLSQGGGVAPQQGDLLIFGQGWLGSYWDGNGHVAVVTDVTSSAVRIVEQNGPPSGTDVLGLNGSTVTANGYTPIIGWLHNPLMSSAGANHISATAAVGGQDIFWRGTDNHLRELWKWNSTWNGPADLSATWPTAALLASAPTSVYASNGNQTVYWRGSGGDLWSTTYAGSWSAPVDLSTAWAAGQMLLSAPSAALTVDGQAVFWQGVNGDLFETWSSASTWYGPVDWTASWGGVAALSSSPAVVVQGSQQLVFWATADGHLWEAWYTGAWNGPIDLTAGWGGTGLLVSAPSATITPGGQQNVEWEGADGHLWESWFNGAWNGPADWSRLGALNSAPSALVSGDQQVVYWQTSSGGLAEATSTNSWNGPADLTAASPAPIPLVGPPATAVTPDRSTQLVFWRDGAGHLDETWYTGRWNGPVDWSAQWRGAALLASPPAVAVSPDGRTQTVYWTGTDGHLWEAWYTGTWNGPVDLSLQMGSTPRLGSTPSVAFTPDGGTQIVFWRGTEGHLWEAWYAGSWNGPVDWSPRLGDAVLTSAPSVVVTPDGSQQLVFWRDAANQLEEAWYTGTWNGPASWTAGATPGALLASAPSAAITSDGEQVVYWQGANGHLWESWWVGARSAPVDWSTAGGGAGQLSSAPNVGVDGGEQLIFWQGAAGHLMESWWGSAWSTVVDLSSLGGLT